MMWDGPAPACGSGALGGRGWLQRPPEETMGPSPTQELPRVSVLGRGVPTKSVKLSGDSGCLGEMEGNRKPRHSP